MKILPGNSVFSALKNAYSVLVQLNAQDVEILNLFQSMEYAKEHAQ